VLRRFEADLALSELKAVRNAKNSQTVCPAAASPPSTPAKSPPTAELVIAAPPARLDSQIVREFPPLFEEFRAKRWQLLWQGIRDSFGGKEFHCRCDSHAKTLPLILNTNEKFSVTSRSWSGNCACGAGKAGRE
jgi:hypothetical protein